MPLLSCVVSTHTNEPKLRRHFSDARLQRLSFKTALDGARRVLGGGRGWGGIECVCVWRYTMKRVMWCDVSVTRRDWFHKSCSLTRWPPPPALQHHCGANHLVPVPSVASSSLFTRPHTLLLAAAHLPAKLPSTNRAWLSPNTFYRYLWRK